MGPQLRGILVSLGEKEQIQVITPVIRNTYLYSFRRRLRVTVSLKHYAMNLIVDMFDYWFSYVYR